MTETVRDGQAHCVLGVLPFVLKGKTDFALIRDRSTGMKRTIYGEKPNQQIPADSRLFEGTEQCGRQAVLRSAHA